MRETINKGLNNLGIALVFITSSFILTAIIALVGWGLLELAKLLN